MSFSNDVKKEICKNKIKNRIEALVELSSIVKTNASISIRNAFYNIVFTTENEDISDRIYKLVKKVYDYDSKISYLENNQLQKNGIYLVTIEDEEVVLSLLKDSGLDLYGNYTVEEDILLSRLKSESENKRAAYIRGCFLGSGSIVDPNKSYHLEIIASKREDVSLILKVFLSFNIEAKVTNRKDKFVIYINEVEKISDFLNIVGANASMLELENITALKELRNNINRQVNCDTANINKTVRAAQKQIEDIKYIDRYIGIKNLPKNLQEIAFLRVNHPESSLKELGEKLDPPLGKSGVSHRLKKIEAISDKHRKEKEKKI